MRWAIMLIAQISDSHISHGGPTDSERMVALGACVDHINRLAVQPSLVVHTGDVVHNGTEVEYEMAAEHLNRLEAEFRVIPGNKDHRGRLHSALPNACSVLEDGPYLQYAVEQESVLLVFLDTMSETSNKGTLCSARLAHLDHVLGTARKPVLLFMHHPSFEVTTAPEPFQFEAREPIDKMAEILSRHAEPARRIGHAVRHRREFPAGRGLHDLARV